MTSPGAPDMVSVICL